MASTEIWVKANRIFDQLSRLDPEQRSQRAVQLCAGEPALQQCVQRLLDADLMEQHPSGLDAPGYTLQIPDQQLIGQRIGPYQVQRQIGEGGMGGVFLATRVMPGQPREVAIKVLKPGLDRRRFVLERQVLEKLDHANIARLVDGGELADGRPFVVMEHIKGQRITHFARHMNLKQLLELYRTLCLAVAYSHTMLVVHRDIKPSNVLVSENGTLKLLDFGIAKLMADNSGFASVSTASEMRPMTPEYSSPEQLLGDRISTRTDVYLLGLLLHELLTGSNPLKDVPQAQRLADISQHTLPAPPSRVAAADAPLNTTHSRLQKIDLDRITQKAISISPDRRYQSVTDLVQDIDNFLDGQPVRARGGSRSYQLAKFLQRNPVTSALSAVIAVLLLTFSLVSTRHSLALRSQMDRVVAENRRAESVTNLLIESFAEADPTRSHAVASAREMLLKAAARLERDLTAAPENLARLRLAMAGVMSRLAMYDQATEQLDKIAALDRQHGITRRQRFEMFRLLAFVGTETRHWTMALSNLQSARHQLTELANADAGPISGTAGLAQRPSTSAAGIDLEVYAARIQARQGQLKGAGQAYQRALGLATEHYPGSSTAVAYVSLEYSEMLRASGQEKRAQRLLEQAHLNAPQVLESAPFWIQMIRAQARSAIRQGDYARALIVYNRGLARANSSFGGRSEEVASMLSGMGTANERLGHRQLATQLYLSAFEISQAQATEGDFILVQRSLNLAQLLAFQGRNAEAAELLGEQLNKHYQLAPEPAHQVPLYEQALARFHLRAHNAMGARVSYRNALLVNESLPFTPAREQFNHQALCEITVLNGFDWRPLASRLLESCLPGSRKNLALAMASLHSPNSLSPQPSTGVTIASRLLEELE